MSALNYIVFGETGEYSDRVTWPVAVYRSEARADEHAGRANAWLKENNVHVDTSRADWDHELDRDSLTNPWDEDFKCDYTGTEYEVVPVRSGGYLP